MKNTNIRLLFAAVMLLATTAHVCAVPRAGLREFRLTGQYLKNNLVSGAVNSSALPELLLQTPGRIVPGPYALNAHSTYTHPLYWPPSVYSGWGNNTTFVYSGFIYIDGSSPVTRFFISCTDTKMLRIDDTLNWTGPWWDSTVYANPALAQGWHKIEIWVDNEGGYSGGGYGPPLYSGVPIHPDRIGFGVDWDNQGPITDYVFPEDPGTGTIFIADPPDGYTRVKTVNVTGITGTSAEFHGLAAIGEDCAGTLRVYYGDGDGVDIPGNWDHFADYHATVVAPGGDFLIPVTGLTPGKEYHYRFAFTNDFGITMAPNTLTFQTEAPDLPARFGWAGDRSIAIWDWNNPAGWVNLDGFSRQIPGTVVGDSINTGAALLNTSLQSGYSPRNFQLTNDVTLAAIYVGNTSDDSGTANHPITFSLGDANVPVTIDLRTVDNEPALIHQQNVNTLNFGSFNAPNNVSLNLSQPLRIVKSKNTESSIYFNGQITGGAPGDYIAFDFNTSQWSSGWSIYFRNKVNTFVGDIVLRSNPNNRPFKVVCGSNINPTGFTGDDRMFGDPSNRIISHISSVYVTFHAPSGFVLNRTLGGLLDFRCMTFHNYNAERDTPSALTLGPNARIEPGINNSFGTIMLTGSTLTFDPDARIRIKVRADGTSDSITLRARSNAFYGEYSGGWPALPPTPGTVNLGGKVEFVSDEYMRAGKEWLIGQTSYTNTVVNGNFKSATDCYKTRVEEQPDGKFNIIAYKISEQSVIVVR